jgi:hypothetical protein
MNPDNIVVFLDSIQRTIIATRINSSNGRLTVAKPVILNVTPTQDKRLQVQLYPLFFREFTADRDDFATWSYDESNIVLSEVNLEPNLVSQYKQMFQTSSAASTTDESKVIKLFDDEKN